MVSPTAKLNNRPAFSAMQVTPNHMLVPIESLTNSPTSSTGSASILEWNSNSDGELLQLSSPTSLTATLSPASLSPSLVFSLPSGDNTRHESLHDLEDPFLSQWEMSPDAWTPLFDGLMAPAPISRGDSNTAVVDDDGSTSPDKTRKTRDAEIEKLCNEFEHGFWTEPYPDLGLPQSLDEKRSPSPSNNAVDHDSSMTSTIVISQLYNSSPGTMATTTDARASVTPRICSPTEIPPLSPFTCAIPNDMSTDSSKGPAFNQIEAEAISIAEYFQRKAMSSEAPPTRAEEPAPQVVEVPSRPASTNSELSYFTQPTSPASPNHQELAFDANDDSQNRHSESENDESSHSQPNTANPSRSSSHDSWRSWKPIPNGPSSHRSPSPQSTASGHNQNHLLLQPELMDSSATAPLRTDSFWPSSPAPFGPLSSPGNSEQDLHSSSILEDNNRNEEPASPSPYSSQSSSPRIPTLPSVKHVGWKADSSTRRARYSLSPEFPRRNMADFTTSLRFAHSTSQTVAPDPDVPNISSLLNPVRVSQPPEFIKPPVMVPKPLPQPLPRSAFSASPVSNSSVPIPNIPSWLVNSIRASQPNATNLGSSLRLRPLPPAPKNEATPQFALRPDCTSPVRGDEHYARAQPSNWSNRNETPPPPPFSPVWGGNQYPSSDASLNSPVLAKAGSLPNVTSLLHPTTSPWPSLWYPRDTMRTPYTTANSQLPLPAQPPYYCSPQRLPFQSQQPSYTGSTLPHDRKLPPPASPNWDWDPPPRRLRFAPFPTPNYRAESAPIFPPYASQPPVFFSHNNIYQTPGHAPVIPQSHFQINTPSANHSGGLPLNTFSNNTYPSSKKYWFSDATVVFRVEDCLYRVHRHFFDRHSDTLSRMLTTYWYDPTSHVFLPGAKKIEFERLLSIFYPTDLTKPDITTVIGWTSILALSQKWQMVQIKALAIQKLTPLTTAVEKLAIAKRHSFLPSHEWILPAYTELCSRRSPLTLEEAEELDLAVVMKIWEVQNTLLNLTYRGMCSDTRISDLVKEKFGYSNYPSWAFEPYGPTI